MTGEKSVKHDGEIIRHIRLLKNLNQYGVGYKMGITQQAFAKLEKLVTIPEKKILDILIALGSSPKEFEVVKYLLYPPIKPE